MNLTYDHTVDAMTIKLTDNLPINTRTLSKSVVIDLDENDQIVGIEVLNVRESGIDPFSVAMTYYTKDHQANPLIRKHSRRVKRRLSKRVNVKGKKPYSNRDNHGNIA